MLKNIFFSGILLILFCFVSCASTDPSGLSIKKGKREYTLSDHYIFDEEGREIFFEGYEKLGDYDVPNLWNAEKRQADYDEKGRLTHVFLDGDRTYPEECFCSYDEEGNRIIQEDMDYLMSLFERYEKSGIPVFEENVPDGTWKYYVYTDDGSYVYREMGHSIKFDEQGRAIYEKFGNTSVTQIWRDFDEQGRACRFKELKTNEYDSFNDQSREIEVTYDKEGFPTYIIETILKYFNSEEMNYICTERFYINKYSYFENGQMNECRQYRYLNRTDEWIPNTNLK